jgi:hypothetical protein
MIIMSKFKKRISKTHPSSLQNALVIGAGFGFLQAITEIYQTVFLIEANRPEFKTKNLIYKETYEDLHLLVDVSTIFFDLSKINDINLVSPVFTRWKSLVVVEGNDPIGRDFTQSLYHHGWRCTSLQGFFHVWELK